MEMCSRTVAFGGWFLGPCYGPAAFVLGLFGEEDDETAPNHVAAGKTTQRLTHRRLRGGHRAADSPQRYDNEGEKPARFKGVLADSAPTSVSEELVTSGSKGGRSGPASKNSVVVVSSRRNSSEQPEDSKAGTASTIATAAAGQTGIEAMADDDEDAGHSVDSSLQDESSMASVTDSQASSSDAGACSKSKQKQGRPGKATAQPVKGGRRRKSEEVLSFEGPATRRRSVRLRSGEKRRGTSPTHLSPAKRVRQKKPPPAAKKQGGRGTRGKLSNGEDESTTESQETLDEEPGANRGEGVLDQSDASMDICPVEPIVIAPLEEEGSPAGSQASIGGCEDNPASTKQEGVKDDEEPETGRQAPAAASDAGASSALHSSSSAASDAPEQDQEMNVETPAESGDQAEQHEKDASEACSTACAESSTAPECEALQTCHPVAVTQPDSAGVSDLALASDVLPVSDSDGKKEDDLLHGQDNKKVQEISTPLVVAMDTSSSVSEESNSVSDQGSQSPNTEVTLQEIADEAFPTDSEAAAVPSHHLLSPTRSPQTVQMAGHRDRRYYCSPEKQGTLDSPEKGPLTPRSSRRKTRWQDAEANVVSEPVMAPVADPSMSPVAVPVASATLPESLLPDWVSSSKPQEAVDAQDIILPPPPPPKAPSPQRKETLASLDSSRPEKVKSRWRRSSELETRDIAPAVAPPSPRARDSPPRGARLSSIREEAPLASSGKESPRKKDRSPPTAPSKEFRESNRESRGGGGGAGSRELPEPSALSRSSRDADRAETSRDRGGSSSGTNGSGTAKPLDYEEIEENLYLFERRKTKSKKEVRRMICDCSLTKDEKDRGIMGCEEDCLNRLLMIECGSRCPNGDNCSNRRFQKKTYINVEKFLTEKKGWGLRTLETLSSGTFVMEYVGEVLTPEEFRKRVKQYARDNNQHYYFMALRSDEIIDATQKGNVSRFINHSCDPNCETQKWTVNGELRIGFFTRRPLRAGEELTFDYQFQRYGKEAQRCHCESSNCRGYIGEDTKMTLKSGRSLPPKRSSSSSSSKRAEERKRDTVEDLARPAVWPINCPGHHEWICDLLSFAIGTLGRDGRRD
ncbi:hypothetical protein V5799_009582 [Amblyomma americanum]|uniref:[histone H3]-lysine(36) N-trimethyltransferase n=1 Tax=Amblyomma americanum TaxID=6943 RepID=A0AAQ4FAK0_AMBAM